MISIVLYGRNDSYGYNLHKRAALGLNTMAEILSAPSDEILFVDYNTPDDHPTFPEAIADTLTDKAAARLRIFRVRPAVHDRYKDRTHLKAIEPIARNVALRRSNPENRWILSTNTDMIFVPRGRALLSEIAADLPRGYYHLPRFELPESLWEGFDRRNPAAVIEQVRDYGRTMFLNEIVYGADCIKYDAPGDFQLILRDDLFRIDGFSEDMLLGWHVDSNIAKRLYLMYHTVGDVVDRLFGYHCDHTRQVTPMHQHKAASNDTATFIDNVTDSRLPHQALTWGCAGDAIEEIRLGRSAHHVYVEGLRGVMKGEWTEPAEARYTYDSFDQATYDMQHVLPFLADLFSSLPREWSVGWIGGRADMFRVFADAWKRFGFRGRIVIEDWSVPLLAPEGFPWVDSAETSVLDTSADVLVFDFSAPSNCSHSLQKFGADPDRLDAAVDRLVRRSFSALVATERQRMGAGAVPRRFICMNAVHNRYETLTRDQIGAPSTPFATRMRHGFVTAVSPGLQQPPESPKIMDAPMADRQFDVLDRMRVMSGGRRIKEGILAPFGRRGYVLTGRPYERLMPGDYQVDFEIEPRGPATLAAYVRPIIVEVVAGDGYLARENVTFLRRTTASVMFSIPGQRREGQTGVEIRLFRGRWVNFVVTGVKLWQLPAVSLPPLRVTSDGGDALYEALGLRRESPSPSQGRSGAERNSQRRHSSSGIGT